MRAQLLVVALLASFWGGYAQMQPIMPEPMMELWHCGTDSYSLSSAVSRRLFAFGCRPEMTQAINQCCLSHDRCYCSRTDTRLMCDHYFCECLRRVTQEGNFFCRVILMESTCFLASKFGDSPYQECSADFLVRIGMRPMGRWNRRK
uniref:DB domain-containing protein n=1 Tax=Steinernema glaseri TaxID=37863 RepID=A0A1I7ZJI8_9BILA